MRPSHRRRLATLITKARQTPWLLTPSERKLCAPLLDEHDVKTVDLGSLPLGEEAIVVTGGVVYKLPMLKVVGPVVYLGDGDTAIEIHTDTSEIVVSRTHRNN